MSTLRLILVVLGGAVLLSSCLREEEPILPMDRGDAIRERIVMGANYNKQIWYDLATQQAVKTTLKTDYTLVFSTGDDNRVWLNSAMAQQATVTESTDLAEAFNPDDYIFRHDVSTGLLDSMVLGDVSKILNQVVLFRSGVDSTGQPLPLLKFQITKADATGYELRIGALEATSQFKSVSIPRDPNYNTLAYDYWTDELVYLEPEKGAYDFVFTQYSFQFYEPSYLMYLVTGVIINPEIQVAADSITPFAEITRDDVDNYTFTNRADIIGYDWKRFNFGTNLYDIKPHKNFIVRDTDGFYFKLHFLDFYDENGVKGSPLMELQAL